MADQYDNFQNLFDDRNSQQHTRTFKRRSSILKTVDSNLQDTKPSKRISFGHIHYKHSDGTTEVQQMSAGENSTNDVLMRDATQAVIESPDHSMYTSLTDVSMGDVTQMAEMGAEPTWQLNTTLLDVTMADINTTVEPSVEESVDVKQPSVEVKESSIQVKETIEEAKESITETKEPTTESKNSSGHYSHTSLSDVTMGNVTSTVEVKNEIIEKRYSSQSLHSTIPDVSMADVTAEGSAKDSTSIASGFSILGTTFTAKGTSLEEKEMSIELSQTSIHNATFSKTTREVSSSVPEVGNFERKSAAFKRRSILTAAYSRMSFPKNIEQAIRETREMRNQTLSQLQHVDLSSSLDSFSKSDSSDKANQDSASAINFSASVSSVSSHDESKSFTRSCSRIVPDEISPIQANDQPQQHPLQPSSQSNSQPVTQPTSLSQSTEILPASGCSTFVSSQPKDSTENTRDSNRIPSANSTSPASGFTALGDTTQQKTSQDDPSSKSKESLTQVSGFSSLVSSGDKVALSESSSKSKDSVSAASGFTTFAPSSEESSAKSDPEDKEDKDEHATTFQLFSGQSNDGTSIEEISEDEEGKAPAEITLTECSMLAFLAPDDTFQGSFLSRNDTLIVDVNDFDDQMAKDSLLSRSSTSSESTGTSFASYLSNYFQPRMHQNIVSCDEQQVTVSFLGDAILVEITLGEVLRTLNGVNIRKIESIRAIPQEVTQINSNKRLKFVIYSAWDEMGKQIMSIAQQMFIKKFQTEQESLKTFVTSDQVPALLQRIGEIEKGPFAFAEEISFISLFYKCKLKKVENKYHFALTLAGIHRNMLFILPIDPATYPNARIVPQFGFYEHERSLYSVTDFRETLKLAVEPGSKYLTELVVAADKYILIRSKFKKVKRSRIL